MYRACRIMLIVSILACVYCLAVAAMQIGGFAYILIAALVIACFAKRGYGALTAFGTAKWASVNELRKAGYVDAPEGLIIGRVPDDRQNLVQGIVGLFNPSVEHDEACQRFLTALQFRAPVKQCLVRLAKAVHTAVFCPTGGGKGVSFVIPHLLTSRESSVVVDFKGENYRRTAEFRRREFGHRIIALDPYRVVTQTPDTLNALDFIDRDSESAIDDCRDLAEAQVIRTGQEKEPHWQDAAEIWIAAMVAAVVNYGADDDRSMQTVRGLLTDPQKMEKVIKLLCESDAWGGMLARLGNQLTNFKDKELASTLTTTNRFLRYLDTLAIADSTKTSSFDPADLRKGKMTVYLILPPDHMRTQSSLLRTWIGIMLRAVVRGGLQEKSKVNFVLDEAASLGHMDALDDAVDKYRGYGVRLQFYYQSLGQLKKCWPEGQEQTLLSNVTQVFCAVNDLPTAEYVSNRLGEATTVLTSGGTSTGTSYSTSMNGQGSTSYSRNQSDNWQQHGRKLLKPEEVMALSERTAVTFTPGVPPVWTTLVRYFEEPNLGRRPGQWDRIKTAAKVLVSSVILLVLTAFIAIGVSSKVRLPLWYFAQTEEQKFLFPE
jgi:type IV secretion system protein VirD4